jgi:Restriction endonuclease
MSISGIAGSDMPMSDTTFDRLSSSKFEQFCFDLLDASGFVNVDWRKGTGFKTSPADKGRDIVCDHPRSDPDGSRYFEKWFVDCKHHKSGVPPKELQNLLAWSEADRPDVALFAVSNFLSNPAKEYLEAYRKNNHPPFKIRCWEKPQLIRMLARKVSLQRKYALTEAPIRSVKQILAAEDELSTRVWYGRKVPAKFYRAEGTPEDIIKGMLRSKREAEKRLGRKSLMANMASDFDWGMVSGKLSAIRWVLGDDWDMLDT